MGGEWHKKTGMHSKTHKHRLNNLLPPPSLPSSLIQPVIVFNGRPKGECGSLDGCRELIKDIKEASSSVALYSASTLELQRSVGKGGWVSVSG